MTTNAIPTTSSIESPASWNTRYLDPSGFECQLTLRGETGQELLERAQGAINFLLSVGCVPAANGKSTNHHASTPEQSQPNGNNGNDRSFCPIHSCTMRKWEKDGRVWFSHKVGDQWCTGKVKS
jgi:hypothetical protein